LAIIGRSNDINLNLYKVNVVTSK